MKGKKYRWRVVAFVVWCLFTLFALGLLVHNIYTEIYGWKLGLWALQTILGVANIIVFWQRVKEARNPLA